MKKMRTPKNILHFIPIISMVIILIIDLTLIFTTHHSWNSSMHRYVPLKAHIDKISTELAIGHLWLEEAITGDKSIDVDEQVISRFQSLIETTHSFLEKSQHDYTHTQDKELLSKLSYIDSPLLHEFFELAKKRWLNSKISSIGSAQDQLFDSKFNNLQAKIVELNSMITIRLKSEFKQRNDYFKLIMSLFILVNILAFSILYYTMRKMYQSEKALEDEKEKALVTLTSIGDAVITTDTQSNVTHMNPVAEQLTGWSFTEALNKPLKAIFPIINASTREPVDNPVDKVLSTGEIVFLSNHTTLIARNGTEYQIADSAAPIRNKDNHILGMILVFNDVTEQYQLREAAAKSRKDLQAIMDHSPAVIYVKDLNSRFTFINKKFEQLFHIQREEIIGKHLHDIFPEEIAAKMQDNDKAVLNAGHALEFEEIAPHDNIFHSYTSIKFPLFDDKDTIYAICGISTDNTERKKQEEQLRRSQKMDALGKLTGGIAHDYNNMLGVVTGYAELLEELLSEQPELANYALEIHRAGDRGAQLTKKLLNFSRETASEAKGVELNVLLHEQQHLLEKTLTVRIKLILELEKNLWPIWLDDREMVDAILNMSINAMYAIEGNGQLTFRTRNELLSKLDAQRLDLAAGDYVMLSVIDTGYGMDNETKEKIFEPFFTTKDDKGTGLGLSQVYGFVKRSNGAIKVYSEQGQGTHFVLYFPRYHKTGQQTQSIEDSKNINFKGNETILIVDDEPSLLNLSCNILSQQGYNTLCAENGRQALEILKTETIDLLFSDVIMPEMDGYQLAAVVQEKYPAIKIQLASGFSDNRHINMPDDELHKHLLQKPFNSQTLLQRIRTLLDQREGL